MTFHSSEVYTGAECRAYESLEEKRWLELRAQSRIRKERPYV
jgi:hypothetical protein